MLGDFRELAAFARVTRPGPDGAVQAFCRLPADRAGRLGARALVSQPALDSLRSKDDRVDDSLPLRAYAERGYECLALRSYLQTLGYRRDIPGSADLGVPLLRLVGSQGSKLTMTIQVDGFAIVHGDYRAPLTLVQHQLRAELRTGEVAALARRATERLSITGHLLLLPSSGSAFDSLRVRRMLGSSERFQRDIPRVREAIAA